MSRPVRWMVAVAAAVVTFVLCLWAAKAAPFGWLPKAEADRWVVATAFATLGAGAVAAAVGWWAGQATTAAPPPPPVAPPAPPVPAVRKVTQKAKASGNARISQVGGNRNSPASTTPTDPGTPVTVHQEATAGQDSTVEQVAGDQHTEPPKP